MANPTLSVLLVEDDADDFALTQQLLVDATEGDVSCEWAQTYEEGLEALSRDTHDVCIVDYRLGDRDGLDLLRHAKASGVRAPIILLSGKAGHEVDVAAMQSGAVDYLEKGDLGPPVVRRALHRALERIAATRELGERERHFQQTWRDWPDARRPKGAERERAQLLATMQALVTAAPAAVYSLDAGGLVRTWNRAAERLFGWTADEQIGRSLPPSLAPAAARHAPGRDNAGADNSTAGTDVRFLRRDGKLIDVRLATAPVLDGSAAGGGTVAVALDMTEPRRAEQALRVTESRLAMTQEIAHLGSWERELDGMGDIDQSVAWWSAETYRIFGRDPSRGPPRFADLIEMVHPVDRTPLRNAVERLAGTGAPFSIVLRVPFPGATERRVLAQATIVRDPEGHSARMLGTMLDITDRHRLEEQVRHAQKMDAIGHLAGGIAHDFNNLLTVILAACEFVADDLGRAGAVPPGIADIRRAAQHATALTQQLLAFGRQQVLQSHAIDPNELVAELAPVVRHIAGGLVSVVVAPAGPVGMVRADRGQLEQVLIDLVAHVRNTLPDGGTLTISCADLDITEAGSDALEPIEAGPYVAVTLRDSGPGLDADSLEHLFDPFFTARSLGRGRGLGLSTAYGVMRQSHGYLLVDSRPGGGTTFTLLLPRSPRRHDAHATVPPRSVPSTGGGETVLVVEDEPSVLSVTTRILRMAGYRVLAAPSGPEALLIAELHEGAIHLLLTDVMMPGMGGVALARRLGAARPATKVIFLSGHSNDVLLHQGVAAERMTFLQKPFSLDALQRRVREVLDVA